MRPKHNQLFDETRGGLTGTPAIRGEKGGGGSQHTPVEAADSLRSTAYATVLDLVSEGDIEGFALGADKMGQCIALDGTLLENPDGSRNFSNVTVDSRSGTQDQDYITGVPDVENSVAVGVQLKAATPWVTRISNTSLSAVRLILSVPNGLQKSDQATGDITGYIVAYRIELSVDDGAYTTVLNGAFSGKASGKYQRAHRIDLPAATDHWNLKVTRLTFDSNSALIADRTDIDAEVDIVDVKMRCPNSALVSVSIDASQFSSIPTRAYFLKGRRVRIPSNYDPVERTYTGVWDGTFKPGYTDNPAWCFFDMATHPRYGLGKFLTDAQVDKWALYNIAQYCDQLVDDGNGGLEPRFTCGLYLQQKADAFKVMQDMATIFRGISYYTGNAIQAVADMPADASFIYDNTNVIGGKFAYAGSSLSSRQTVALVSWNDLTDLGKAKVEYVEDQEGIARYGVRTTEVTAIGETRRGGAHRAGRHILFTNRMETETVTFSVGLDGDLAAPGQIIKIVDHDRAGKRQGGRIKNATTTVVTVDQAPDAVVGDTLSVNMPDGVIQTRTISAVDGAAITVGTEFTESPQAEAVWTVEKTTLAAQTFRVIGVKENNAEGDTVGFSLTCIQHAPEKFAAIDDGLILQPRPITSLAAPSQDPVTGISITYHIVYRQGTAVTVMRIEWVKPVGAVRYAVEWRRGDGTWIPVGASISETAVEVEGVYAGVYQARITAYNVNGVPSVPVISSGVQIDGKNVAPPAPTLHAVGGLFEIDLSWDFPTSSNVSDTSYTEIQTDTTSGMLNATTLGTYAYPLNVAAITGLTESETRWVRARLVDKTGNIGDWSVPVSATTSTTDNLFQPINDEISALQTDVDSRIGSLQTEADNTLAQVQVLQGQVGDILKADVWDSGKTYPLGDLVQETGKLYRSLIDNNLGNDPATTPSAWEDIGNYSSLGEAVGATAANVATLQNTVTQQGTDITANSQSINENAAAIGTKADASALSATNATVTQQGNTITSQGQDIAALQSTVNDPSTGVAANAAAISNTYTKTQTDGVASSAASNATSSLKSTLEAPGGSIYAAQATANDAQSAAQAASDLAGGKGKVFFQTTAPAAADRVSQNLWIDTTNGANTPKRWNGTAWVAVTDKVATDAAAAAANALSVANTKLDASVINNYYTKTQTDGNINSAVGSAQTALQANIDTKASTAALDSLSSTVTQQGNDITANASAITAVQAQADALGNYIDWAQCATRVPASDYASGYKMYFEGNGLIQAQTFHLGQGVLAPGRTYSLRFSANVSGGTCPNFHVDLFPDTLPEVSFNLPVGINSFTWEGITSPSGDMSSADVLLRFFGAVPAGVKVDITDVILIDGPTAASVWRPGTRGVSNAGLATASVANSAKAATVTNDGRITANADAIQAVSVRMPSGTGTVATKASVDAVSGKVNASYTLSLDANGRVVGYVFQNNGTTGSIVFRADVFSIVSPTGTGARTEYSGGNWRVYDSSGVLRVRLGIW